MPDFTFDEPTHTYRVDGAVLPSVTGIIKPISPDFSMVPSDVLEARRRLGQAVHLACEFDDLGELDEFETDEVVMCYVEGWRKFKTETAAVVLANERQLYHPTLRFAGTLDRVAELRSGRGPHHWLLDLKIGLEPYPSYGVQTAGYQVLLSAAGESFPGLRRGTVHLREDGTYRLHPFNDPNDEAAFMACLAIHQWKANHA